MPKGGASTVFHRCCVIPQQVGDFSLWYVEYFTQTTFVRNQIYSVIKEPHCASVESFHLLSLLAQSYSRSIARKTKSKSHMPRSAGETALFIPTANISIASQRDTCMICQANHVRRKCAKSRGLFSALGKTRTPTEMISAGVLFIL
jgi:hypothetical protein